MSAIETITVAIIKGGKPNEKKLVLVGVPEDTKVGKKTIRTTFTTRVLGTFKEEGNSFNLISSNNNNKIQPLSPVESKTIDLYEAVKNGSLTNIPGLTNAGAAAIARSLGMGLAQFKDFINTLVKLPYTVLPDDIEYSVDFTTRNAAKALDRLAAGPTSFAGAFGPGGGGGAGISLSSTPFVRGTGDTEEDAIAQSVALAAMIADAALLPNSAMAGGKRKQSGGMPRAGRNRTGRGVSVPASIPEEGAGGATASAAATVENSGSAAVANVELTESAPPAAAEEGAGGAVASASASASPAPTVASGRGGRPARRGASVAPAVTEATVSQIATGPPGGIGIAPTVIDTASAAAVATQVTAVTTAIIAGAPVPPTPPSPGVPTVVPPPAPTFQAVKNLFVGHLVEWMNANGTFVQNGKDLIMRELYDFLSNPSTKSLIQTTAKATSIGTATLAAGSVAAAFVAPGAVLDIYLLMFSYITGVATTIIGSPLNIISNLIVKLLFYIPEARKFEIFNQIVGQVGALGDNAGLRSLILQLCPQAASLPGFATGMFVADLAIGSYILLNLHRQMGKWSPFTLAGKVTQATFGPLIESVQGAALRVSTDVRLLATKLTAFTEFIFNLSKSYYPKIIAKGKKLSEVMTWTSDKIKISGKAIYNGTSAVAGLGNTAFWVIISRGFQACAACSSLLSACSLLLKMPNAAVGLPVFTPTQLAAGAAIVSVVHNAAGVPENAAGVPKNAALSDINSAAAATVARSITEDIVNEAADVVLKIQDDTKRKREAGGGGGGGGSAAGSGGGGGGGAGGMGLGGGRRKRRYAKTHKRRNHKRKQNRTKKHPKRR